MLTPVTIDSQAYLCPSWTDMGELTVKLAEKIKAHDSSYDRIIALAKGGWGWARQLQDFLGIKNLASIQISFYTHIKETKKTPVITQALPVSVAGESVLIYDDVVDYGDTIALAKDYLTMHGAAFVHTASHFSKPWAKTKPDFFGQETDSWIIFPHDTTEMIKLLKDKWPGISSQEFRSRLHQIGMEESIINLALKAV